VSHPAVDLVLSAIKDNWSAGSYSDIPLERIDRDNSKKLAGNIRSHTEDLQNSNYVGAAYQDRETSPIGTSYDHELDVVIGVRIEGLHHSEFGYVDPDANLPPATAGDPVPWRDLVKEIRDAITDERRRPDTGQSDVEFADLTVLFEDPGSTAYGDAYRHDLEISFGGFEDLR